MRLFTKKRLLTAAGIGTTVAAAATLVAGVSFGLFSAQSGQQTNSFTAGTVSLGAPTLVDCAIGPMSPGDDQATTGNNACTFTIAYSGDVDAYLALDLELDGTSGTPVANYGGTTPTAADGLFDGSADGLQIQLTDDHGSTYVNGTTWNTSDGTSQTMTADDTVSDLLVTASPVDDTYSVTFTVNYNLPTTAGNAYNGAKTDLKLRVHAVQAGNNDLPLACDTAGNQCDTTADAMSWS